jgi:hypothetical protein
MVRYQSIVSEELLPEVESGDRLPAGLRMVRVVGPAVGHFGEPPSYRAHYVEFEDDNASAYYEGKLVDLTFQAHYDGQGQQTHTTISDYQALS